MSEDEEEHNSPTNKNSVIAAKSDKRHDNNFDVDEENGDDQEDNGSEEEPNDDDDYDNASDAGEAETGLTLKLKRKRPQKEKSKSTKRRGAPNYKLFSDEADVADESEDEDDEYDQAKEDQVLAKDELMAIAKVEERHKASRDYIGRSDQDIVADIKARHRSEARMKQKFDNGQGGFAGRLGSIAVAQQALLPSVKDPKIFKLKVKPGNELIMVKAILLKTIEVRNKGGLLKIKSAFCTSVKGFIYIEALTEAFAKEIIQGLRGIYGSSFSQIPVSEMTSVISVTVQRKPLRVGQWVRIKRGPLKGDLARVISLFEGGSKAFIQAVPRPDYTAVEDAFDVTTGKKIAAVKSLVRPQQRLFDAEEARACNNNSNASTVFRRHHPLDSSSTPYDLWNNDYYKGGFLYKEVNVATYLDESTNDVKPKLEELQLFQQRKIKRNNDDDDDNDNDDLNDINDDAAANNANFLKELAEQIDNLGDTEENGNKGDNSNSGSSAMNPFLPGDLVQVTRGDMKNLIARIVSVNDATRLARIVPYKNVLITAEMSVEVDLLVKYIYPGAHVKVVAGRYMGQTGRVVSVMNNSSEEDGSSSNMGDSIAAILTDGINTEIQCNVGHLQMSSEVTTGYSNLNGYELYDIVELSEHEFAVVIVVGTEKLRCINHTGLVKDILPVELRGKRNHVSSRSTAFDISQSTITVGDTVTVSVGNHAKTTGTVKQMMKGTLWLHSNSYLKNSGIFVTKSRNCVVAGSKSVAPVLSASYKGVLLPSGGSTSVPGVSANTTPMMSGAAYGAGAMARGGNQQQNGRRQNGIGGVVGQDAMVGMTVRITKGQYKALLAQVIDATPTHFSVELLAKLKKIVIERTKTVLVGDKEGSLIRSSADDNSRSSSSSMMLHGYGGGGMDVPATPYLTAATPSHFAGSETPHYGILGSETPMHLGGDATPSASRTPRSSSGYGGGGAYGGSGDAAVWTVNAADQAMNPLNSVTSSMQNSPGDSLYSTERRTAAHREARNGWDSASLSSFQPSSITSSNHNSILASVGDGSSSIGGGGNSSRYSHASSSNSTIMSVTSSNVTSGVNSIAHSGANTPMTIQAGGSSNEYYSSSSYASATPIGGISQEITYKDWKVDMVVKCKRGIHIGRLAVIQQPADMNGMLHVSLRDSKGRLTDGGFSVHYEDLELAVPTKRETVVILGSGRDAGKTAVVTNVKRNDLFLDLGIGLNGEPNVAMFRSNRVAWMNSVKP